MKITPVLFLMLTAQLVFGGPGTYYNSIDTTQSCAAFMTILKSRLNSGVSYIDYAQVDNNYNLTDLKASEIGGGQAIVDRYCTENPNGTDYCVFRYSTNFCMTTPPDTSQCVCYNKEHAFPKSWFGSTYPAYSDMHFVWPADNRTNMTKSNFTIGYAKNVYFSSKNGSKVGVSDNAKNFGYTSSNVFEPIDSFKGDFARAYLYVVTRYLDSLNAWKGRSTADYVLAGSAYPGFDPWILQLCVQWHKLDPPSAFEKSRNDAVYSIQGNRNPYVDYPHWVEKVFGVNGNSAGCVPAAVKQYRPADFKLYPNPANGLVTLIWNDPVKNTATLQVADILGRICREEKLQAGTKDLQLDISALPKGMYWIQVGDAADVSAVPLIVQ